MASTWAATASNETISFNNLQNGVDTGVLSQKAAIPVSNEQITKADANTYVNIDTSFAPYAAKSSNQLVVKSNLQSVVSVGTILDSPFNGIANNESTSSPIQLISGEFDSNFGFIFRSTDYGVTYSSVLNISNQLNKIKFMPAFRHASYLSVVPFVSVGFNGRIVTNSVNNCTSWITISSPTTQELYDIAFNSTVGIIVGNQRIIKTNTNNRINSWSIVNSVARTWRSVASNGSTFIAVGDNSAIITGDSLGTTWTVRTLPAPLTLKNLRGVTYHTDGFWYAAGSEASNASQHWIMRSSDDGVNWSEYFPTGTPISGELRSINSIGGRLIVGAINVQYQIFNNVVTSYNTPSPFGRVIAWEASVKDANSNGFDMAGFTRPPAIGAFSNF
jgi:hypothetical protein